MWGGEGGRGLVLSSLVVFGLVGICLVLSILRIANKGKTVTVGMSSYSEKEEGKKTKSEED